MGADVEGSEPPLRLRRRRRTSGHGHANRKLQPVDDSDSIRDRREGTWTRLELIEMDERFCAGDAAGAPGDGAAPERRRWKRRRWA